MTRRKLSEHTLREAEMRPRRRHAALSIGHDGTPRLSGRVLRPVVWFERSGYASTGDGKERWYSSDDFTITAVVDGTPSLLLYFEARRLNSAVFALNLLPGQLEFAIEGARRVGLGSLIRGALEEMRRQVRRTRHDTPALRAVIKRYLSRGRTPDARRDGATLEGALVRFERIPPWVRRLPLESRRVFEFCVGHSYRVDEVTSDGHLVLDVSADADARFGGFMNDIRVEPQYVRVVADGGAKRTSKRRAAP